MSYIGKLLVDGGVRCTGRNRKTRRYQCFPFSAGNAHGREPPGDNIGCFSLVTSSKSDFACEETLMGTPRSGRSEKRRRRACV